ncbi:MAG: hypothetical protein R2788_01440 [Saprospiraceae bacterium]
MKKTVIACLLACLSIPAISQLNMTLLDQVNYGVDANDIWAWFRTPSIAQNMHWWASETACPLLT